VSAIRRRVLVGKKGGGGEVPTADQLYGFSGSLGSHPMSVSFVRLRVLERMWWRAPMPRSAVSSSYRDWASISSIRLMLSPSESFLALPPRGTS
jgi:hypothetical protein